MRPPALAVAAIASREVGELVRMGDKLRSQGEATSAEPLLRRAVAVADSPRSAETATSDLPAALNALGMLCKDLAEYDEARGLYSRALAVLTQSGRAGGHDAATLLHNLAGVEHARRDFAGAEPLARRGLALRRALGDDDEALARDMVALGAILDGQRKFDEAEVMYLEGLAILERAPDQNAVDIAVALNNLGAQYLQRGRTTDALELLSRADAIKRDSLGARHPDRAVTLNNLAEGFKRAGDVAAARAAYRTAVEILEAALGAEHPKTVACRRNLSNLENTLMSNQNDSQSSPATVRIDLTADQKQVVKAATSREADAIELTVEELEQRIAPFSTTFRLALNHNETLLCDEA